MFSLENKTNLLNKRLARSLWGTRIRLIAVIGMIFVVVFAGITFGGYSANLGPMYDSIYEDSDSGTNLADLWIDNSSTIWSLEEVESSDSTIFSIKENVVDETFSPYSAMICSGISYSS